MEALLTLPTLEKNQWDIINSNGVGVGKYNPMNWAVMDNALIKSMHDLNNTEQILFEYLVSSIDLKKPTLLIEFKKIDILNFLFPKTKGKKTTKFSHFYYKQLSIALKRLDKTEITTKLNKEEVKIKICSIINHRNIQYIIVEFSRKIFPFLCYLNKNFTKYRIGYIGKLKGKYSIYLYKYFIMNINIRENNKKILWQEDLEDLKLKLNIKNKYNRFNHMKECVLDPAIKEINKYTDIRVEYDTIRGGVSNLQVMALEFKAKKLYKETAIEKSKNRTENAIFKKIS